MGFLPFVFLFWASAKKPHEDASLREAFLYFVQAKACKSRRDRFKSVAGFFAAGAPFGRVGYTDPSTGGSRSGTVRSRKPR